jgi:hypothetical protein
MRIRSIALALLSLPLAVAGLLVGCGGDDSSAVVDGGGGNDASVNDGGGGDTGNPQPDGSTSDTGTNDGTAPGDGGGGASNPGKITCGSTECDSTTQVCCVRFTLDGGADGGAGQTHTCTAPNACQGGGAFASECDEKADCPQNQRCCLGFANLARGQCQNSCQGSIQACKTNPECGDGGACATHTCPQNLTVQTCTKPVACN